MDKKINEIINKISSMIDDDEGNNNVSDGGSILKGDVGSSFKGEFSVSGARCFDCRSSFVDGLQVSEIVPGSEPSLVGGRRLSGAGKLGRWSSLVNGFRVPRLGAMTSSSH